mmetsp:Transcript_11404/g.32836  ORF Transcript_11404/g.32836 Transcript_11404/m.32836 type:complete len:311 (-) Transcript_11404:99-1031(-)|eukprot:CAMPEP_0118999474 /NCGR_PEP_ID=MMETSP1173-20130426/63594_1 /TAXON_ID=1034831 /ORGANISM="Rhizochromulina marina cf, Strain CCMP1243" /LENGTH=310 /DNA_ID=CAMNT_0006950975 /DNA_START=31 /DNA_END=963 /DNA_ORIENTATION=-
MAAEETSELDMTEAGESWLQDWEKLERYDSCVCPLTLAMMVDPVSTVDGQTYERSAIEEWLEHNDTSPATGLPLESKLLVPNLAIKKAMEEFLRREPQLARDLAYASVSSAEEQPVKRINLLIVGPSGVGKSSLLRRVRKDSFDESIEATYGMNFEQQLYRTGDNLCAAKVWDTSGQPHLRDTVRTQYRMADAIIFVFDVTRRETLDQLVPYITEAKEEASSRPREHILVANKIDDSNGRQVTPEDSSEFVSAQGLNDYREVSAKSGANVALTFRRALTHAAFRQPLDKNTIKLGPTTSGQTRGKCCVAH